MTIEFKKLNVFDEEDNIVSSNMTQQGFEYEEKMNESDNYFHARHCLTWLYVFEMLKSCSSSKVHVTPKFIQERVFESYGCKISRGVLAHQLEFLVKENLIHKDTRGYWYEEDDRKISQRMTGN